ncbi:unnamed protein product, partial [Prorocentrum cordatum]
CVLKITGLKVRAALRAPLLCSWARGGDRDRPSEFSDVVASIAERWSPSAFYENPQLDHFDQWLSRCLPSVITQLDARDFDYLFTHVGDDSYEALRQRIAEDVCRASWSRSAQPRASTEASLQDDGVDPAARAAELNRRRLLYEQLRGWHPRHLHAPPELTELPEMLFSFFSYLSLLVKHFKPICVFEPRSCYASWTGCFNACGFCVCHR